MTQKILRPNSSSPQPSYFKQSQIKQSQLIIAQPCCSRHLYCIHHPNPNPLSPSEQSFSIDSGLLQEINPSELSAEPLIEYQVRPEVDLLGKINLQKKTYEKILKECEEELNREERQKKLIQIQKQAKLALEKSNKIAHKPKSQWGHSIYTIQNKKQEDKSQKDPQKQVQEDIKNERKIQMKPISERITEYKQKQILKNQQQRKANERQRKQIDIRQKQIQIQKNAQRILEQMKKEKEQKQEERKVIQAKIRALQLKSLQKIKIAKKKPLTGNEQFNLGDSQYSTFSARAQGRKREAPKKKTKQNIKAAPQIQLKKSTFLKKSSTSTQRNKKISAPVTQNLQQPAPQPQQIPKGPFFIWNIPVLPEEIPKIQNSSSQPFLNLQRFNNKNTKTFREQANEYLANRASKNMQSQTQSLKHKNFWETVQSKKQQLLKTYQLQTNFLPTWNEDQLFQTAPISNFPFHTAVTHQ